jgi:hypothetical protein
MTIFAKGNFIFVPPYNNSTEQCNAAMDLQNTVQVSPGYQQVPDWLADSTTFQTALGAGLIVVISA